MKKNLKRWLALLLAITMIVTSGAFTNLTYLRATDSETPEAAASAETQQETKTEEKEKEKKQEVKVEAKDDKAAEEAKKAEEEAKAKAEEQKKAEKAAKAEEQKKTEEAAKADEQKKAEEAAKADEQKAEESATTEEAQKSNEETKTEETVTPAETAQEGQKAEESAKEENKEQTPEQSQAEETAPEESKTEEAEVKTYEVKIEKPSVDGGSVKIWSDGDKTDASNGGTQTVKEGETFYLQIATKEGYSVEQVTDQDGKTIDAKDIKDNTYSYELNDVKENKTLNISYKEEKQDEVTYPAFNHKDSKDGVTANISAPEGVFPEGTTVELKALSADDRAAIAAAAGCEASDVLGLDITFKYEGKEIQPTGDVKVSFSADEIKDADEASVYHVNNGGSVDKIGGSKDGASVGFTADSFSPYGVVLQSNNNDVSTTALSGGNTVKVGEMITLTGTTHNCPGYRSGKNGIYHSTDDWSSSNTACATVTGGLVRGIAPGTVTITHTYCTGTWNNAYHHQTETIVVTVTPKMLASDVTLTGTDTVKVADQLRVTPVFTPADASAVLTWESSDENVLTVDANGKVTGVTPGTAKVTVHGVGADGKVLTAEKQITVEAATESTDDALFYYMVIPTGNPKLNDTVWGSCLGTGEVTVKNAAWSDGNKNSYDNVRNRVVSWPGGSTGTSYEVADTSSHWTEIFNAYKTYLSGKLGYTLEKDDVEAIILHPYKISQNNASNPDKHVDCTVEIKVKEIYTATYKLQDAGKTGYEWAEADTFREGEKTSPTGIYPAEKTDANGVKYTFVGWYDNPGLSGSPVTFPYTMTQDQTFYAKYVAGHYVEYDLAGGTWSSSQTKYFKNEGDTVYVVNTEPTKDGYEFKGWKFSEDNSTLTKDDSFTMPNHDVTLTAIWEPKAVEYTVNYYWNNTAKIVRESETVSGHTVGESVTESPAAVAGYTVVSSDAQTIKLGANATQNVINFYYYKNVTLTANSNTVTYTGKEQSVSGFISSETAADFGTITVGAKGTDAGEYDAAFVEGTVGTVDVTKKYTVASAINGKLTIAPATLTIVTPPDKKTYDGTALKAQGKIDGFVNGETATFVTTGSQTEVGSSSNSYEITWNGTAKESNYTVNETIGTLTVTETTAEIVVTTTGGEFTYDGKAHGATVTVSELPKGYRLETATSNATATNVTTKDVKATCDTLVIRNKSGEDVTGKLNIKKVDGTIKITPATLTVVTPDANKAYDGTALTAAGTISGFVNGETAYFTTTGTQTIVGTSPNSYEITWNGTAKAGNYTVSENVGTLEVTKGTIAKYVTLTPQNVTKTYDGQPLVAGTAVARDRNGNALTVEYQKADGNWTTDRSEITATDVADTKTVNVRVSAANYDGYVTAAETVTITPATLTVKTPDANKVYDGTPLTKEGTISGFVNGEEATFKTTGSQTTVGESSNTYSLSWDKTAKPGNYTIAENLGTLKVTESTAKITVTTTGGEFTYNGKAHGATVQVTGVPAGYTVETATSSASATDVTETAVTATCDTLVIKNAQGEDVTAKLNIERVDGKITVTPATLTVVTPNGSKVYDGKALTKAGEIKGFVNGETATFETTGSQTEVGSSPNSYEITWDGTAKKSNYTVKETVGTLTVTETAEEIVVTTTGGEFTYDGTAHGATVTVAGLPEGYTLEKATSSATATDVTTEDVKATCDTLIIKNASGKDVTASLKIKKVDGTIKITPATLTVVTPDANKAYDGTALTAAGTISGFVNGETAGFATTGSQTNVGKSKNTYKITWNGTAKESNYTVSESVGILEVTKGTIAGYVTLTPQDVTKTYDGQPLLAGTAKAEDSNGNALTVEYQKADGSWTTDRSEITATNVDDTKDIHVRVSSEANYAGYVYGTQKLEITKRKETLKSETASKTYDGTALTKPEVTVTGDGFVDGEVSDIKANGSVTYVEEGEVTNNITYTTGDNFKESNYEIAKEEGKLHIEAITTQITVTAQSDEKVYDGTPLTKQGVTYTANVLLEGDRLVATVSGSQTDAGSSANVVTSVKVMRGEQDVTENYTFGEWQNGTLEVTPREIKLTSGSDEKTYDGTPLRKNEVTVTAGSFVDGEGFDYDVTGSQTYVGNSANTFTYAAKEGTKLTNYEVTTKYGTLNVKQSADEITITAPSASKKYDGTPLTLTSGATYTGKLADGDVLRVTLAGSQTDYGTSAVTVAGYRVIRMVDGVETDVTANYKFGQSVPGTLSVTKRKVTLTSGSGKKTYDGTPLTNNTVTVNGDGFAKGEGAAYNVTGSQLDAGKSENTFSYTLNENTNPANYEINTVKGDLIVDPIKEQTITITANSANKTYDGKALTDNGYTYTEGVLVNGDVLTAVVEGSVTNVDDANNSNVVTSYKVMRGDTDVTKNYTFTASVNGTLTINPRSIKLTSATDEKPYDGTPLTNATITVSDPGFVAGEGATYDVTGTQTLVGSSENTFTYELNEGTREANYVIETAFGTLTVSDEDVDPTTVVTKSHADKADGGRYDLGETVTFTITVKNPYDTAKTITLTEQGGVTLKDTVFENVAPGATVSTTATYKITEEDVKAGNYHNEVTAAFSDGKTFTGTDDVDPEDGKAHLKVIKAVVGKKDGYALGEEVKYSIYVKNDGNLTVEGVKVRDELTGDILDFGAIAGHTQSEPQEVIYTITEEDIVRGSVQNVATVTEGKDPSGKKPESEDGTETVTTEDIRNELVVEKVADQKTNVKAGDEITYTITVTNNGNVTVKGLTVADTLTGDTFKPSLFDRMTLAPGAFKTFTVTYTVTEADLIAGEIVNVATATAKDPKNTEVTGSDTETVTTTQAIADYTVEKTVDNPQNEYKVGDVIHYTITVTNTGTMTLNNLVIKDQMQGTNGEVVIERQAGVRVNGTTATITKLAVGASSELKASYTVARADADGTLANRVNVTSTTKPGEDPENPNGPTIPSKSGETDPTPTEKTYVLTIHYVDNNGNAVAPDYTARLLAGETIDAVVSPAIDGYTPNFGTVVLPATGMPAANITVTVIYTPDGPDEVLDDPENPNRPNNGGNNGGGNAVNNNNNNANNANNADNGNNAANNNAGQADANPAPADGVIQPDDNGGYDLTPVEDTPTPLANMNLDDHACCILHFLIMLLTLIIFALYTKSRKNRQLKVEELREQLAIASIQKELDLSDEDMAKYLEEAKKLAEEKKQANA